MNMHSKKAMGWTAALLVFLSVLIVARFQWQILAIPGAILVWYGLVARTPHHTIALQKRGRTGLN